ncbi:MAG: DUF2460 domain-containing protein [Pseudomonadota bacterium]
MAFHDVRFPMQLALGATGGPEWRTDIATLASGAEVRNRVWSQSRRRWGVGGALTDLASLQVLVAFFEARRGRLHGFRFRDPIDHLSCLIGQDVSFDDQTIGTGDGTTQVFQLTLSRDGVIRSILKPLADTVQIGIDGQAVAAGWTVDPGTGQVTFEMPPGLGLSISAGFEYDCPVRFDSDHIGAVIEAFGAGRIATLDLVELAEHQI